MKLQNAIILAASLVTSLGTNAALASDAYPSKPIRLVLGWAAGSSTDVTGRIVARHLQARLKQSIVIDNKPGADGSIAAVSVARAEPDGYTLLIGSNSTHGSNATMIDNLPYDAIKDFEPIAKVSTIYYVLVTRPDMPARDARELIQAAKANPRGMNLASTGGISHLAGELFQQVSGTEWTAVPYKDTPRAFIDLTSGRVDALFQSPASVWSQVTAGRMKAMATTSPNRLSVTPGVPTFSEMGLPGFEVQAWIGFFAPKGTPKAIVDRLNAEVNAVLRSEEARKDLRAAGTDESAIVGGTSEELRASVVAETEKWKRAMASRPAKK